MAVRDQKCSMTSKERILSRSRSAQKNISNKAKCQLDEMGRNSVIHCTNQSNMLRLMVIYFF